MASVWASIQAFLASPLIPRQDGCSDELSVAWPTFFLCSGLSCFVSLNMLLQCPYDVLFMQLTPGSAPVVSLFKVITCTCSFGFFSLLLGSDLCLFAEYMLEIFPHLNLQIVYRGCLISDEGFLIFYLCLGIRHERAYLFYESVRSCRKLLRYSLQV